MLAYCAVLALSLLPPAVIRGEAEAFVAQRFDSVRKWEPGESMDAEGAVVRYLTLMPDTRRTHDDPLIRGENFTEDAGTMAVLSYEIDVPRPGRYHVWVRCLPQGTEDNGIHVGIDGRWPESGKRMQFGGTGGWVWGSRQRTRKVHQGIPGRVWLDIATPGRHTLEFSMREDGFTFDRWELATDIAYRPAGAEGVDAGAQPRGMDGDGTVDLPGDLRQWHRVDLDLRGPWAAEEDLMPNPFVDAAMTVRFEHESGLVREVPGYFAADGNAAETGADRGNVWRAHLSPELEGRWRYTVSFRRGVLTAAYGGGEPWAPYDGVSGEFQVGPSLANLPDFRARGRLAYAGGRYLRFLGDGTLFFKVGADSPETLLATADFDGTVANKPNVPLKAWLPHAADARPDDPTWGEGRGAALLGALNYLASAGANSISFLTYNAGGDGDNVWPFVSKYEARRYDVSKLDQWARVFGHAQQLGLFLHFKLQETENDDLRSWPPEKVVDTALDDGKTRHERRVYLREMVARFGWALALNWNLGEETTQNLQERMAMATYLASIDPYDHPIVIHTYPNSQAQVYQSHLGPQGGLQGVSLQAPWNRVYSDTLRWVAESRAAGLPWIVANDEVGPSDYGVPPDPGYAGFDGWAGNEGARYTLDDIRRDVLWGNLMGGGAGVEYYAGYKLPETDLNLEDWRSRDRSWHYGAHAVRFFQAFGLPFERMTALPEVVSAPDRCLGVAGEVLIIQRPRPTGPAKADLSGMDGRYQIRWYDPRLGGDLVPGSVETAEGGGPALLGSPPSAPAEDWVIVLTRL